jgi:hypothetical protein
MSRIKDFFQRINRAATEVGIEHFHDDKDWDERVKLPAWQTARLRERYERKKAKRAADNEKKSPIIAEMNADKGRQALDQD